MHIYLNHSLSITYISFKGKGDDRPPTPQYYIYNRDHKIGHICSPILLKFNIEKDLFHFCRHFVEIEIVEKSNSE
ncbi:MAG: hypothetical protein P8M03_01005 [Flavobacteriaceae bacterium]|nr:hypothetical protein [Flavobacteriaceae bacterium]